MAVVKDSYEIWLLNTDAETAHDLGPSELFGFNVGEFTEKSPGRVDFARDFIYVRSCLFD